MVFNFNGMSIADTNAKLGQQKELLVPRSLKGLISKTDAPLSLIDCVILKKFPTYYLEFFAENEAEKSEPSLHSAKGSRCQIRSLQTAEYLQE